jgi:hypothetical protein
MAICDKYHFAIENFLEVLFRTNGRSMMTKHSTITKLGLGIAVAVLFSCSAIAAPKKSNSLHKRSLTYYRTAPVQTYNRNPSNRNPFVYSVGGRSLYHNDVLPDGTVTGPIGPEANGG